jgi:hypothetical protein
MPLAVQGAGGGIVTPATGRVITVLVEPAAAVAVSQALPPSTRPIPRWGMRVRCWCPSDTAGHMGRCYKFPVTMAAPLRFTKITNQLTADFARVLHCMARHMILLEESLFNF